MSFPEGLNQFGITKEFLIEGAAKKFNVSPVDVQLTDCKVHNDNIVTGKEGLGYIGEVVVLDLTVTVENVGSKTCHLVTKRISHVGFKAQFARDVSRIRYPYL